MKRNRSGSSAVVVVVVVALIVAAVAYFWSKPFQTKVDEAARQAREWTPENIQKDPVGYLTWAQAETQRTEDRLNASALSLRTKKNQIERETTAGTADQDAYRKLLDEAKERYRTASAANQWPVDLRGTKLDEGQLKAKIVEANTKVASIQETLAAYSKAHTVIERKFEQVEAKLVEVQKLRARLSTDLEIAKVNKSVEGIGAINDQVSTIMDTANALVSQQDGGVSLEDLVTPSGKQRIDEEFSKIMGQ